MAETRYTNKKLDNLFEALDNRQQQRHADMLDRMKAFESVTTTALGNLQNDMSETVTQTQKTNGRVTSLEGKVVSLQDDRKWLYRIVTVIGVLIVPVLGWALFTLANIQTTIGDSITQTLRDDYLLSQQK